MTFLIVLLFLAAFFIPLCWIRSKPLRSIVLTVVNLVLLSFGLYYAGLYTDSLWFQNLGYDSVFWTRVGTQWTLLAVFGAIAFLILSLNAWLLGRAMRPTLTDDERQAFNVIAYLVSAVMGLLIGLVAIGKWADFLLYFNQVKSGVLDPIFQKDLSFYFFSLPIQDYLSTFLLLLLIGIGVIVGIIYATYGVTKLKEKCLLHGSLLGAGIFLVVIWKFVLAKYHLLLGNGVVMGVGYTDVHVRIPVYNLMIAVSVIVAAILVLNLVLRKWKISVAALGSFFVIWLIAGLAVPAYWPTSGQYFTSKNELLRESTYIGYNIQWTREAYGLGQIEEKEFQYQPIVSPETLARNQDTLENIRLWDWRPLISSYEQRQGLRKYYEFSDVDIDRYIINGKYRQVMLAPRELEKSKLDPTSQTWVNKRFKYTHGYGVALNQVNEFDPGGMPKFLIKDIPPQSTIEEIQITRPEIYYGLLTRDHVIVKTTEEEFDYPYGDQNVTTTYQGSGGVEIGGGLRKLALAIKFDGFGLFFADNIKLDSRLMFYRQIEERVKTLAPFLKYDEDPYLVIDSQGKLWWIIDAYTTSSRYPYSESYNGQFNYIRNSVKVTIDAYNGSVTFYVFDESDPIIKTYQRIFPVLFKSKDEMPQDLKAHVRYPEDLISIQGKIYSTYHMTDPEAFYNKEDLWRVAEEVYALGKRQEVIPYYVIIRLPGEEKEEFIQMIPFTPKAEERNNLVGWLAGRSDGENYGKILAFKFSKQLLVYGPMQFEARVDQNDEMSKTFSLWGQKGSDVIRGNTLVIPIENTILYVEPVYLKAELAQMPEIKRVIVAMGDRLEWGNTFDEALRKVMGTEPVVVTPPAPTPSEETVEELVQRANYYFQEYQRLTGEGKLVEAAQALEKLQEALRALEELTKK